MPLALLSTLTAALVLQHAAVTRTRCRDTKLQVIGQWSEPGWNWGSANGEAHNEALRIRSSLSTPDQRERFLTDVGMLDEEDWEDSKVVLRQRLPGPWKGRAACVAGSDERYGSLPVRGPPGRPFTSGGDREAIRSDRERAAVRLVTQLPSTVGSHERSASAAVCRAWALEQSTRDRKSS